jgi:uncharacterized membrane protein
VNALTLAHAVHLVAATLWAGGTLAVSIIVHPVLRARVSAPQRLALYREIGRRFSYMQWACWALLLGTGLFKLQQRGDYALWAHERFGRVLALKLALVTAMAVLSARHSLVWGPRLAAMDPRDPGFAAQSRRAGLWGRVNAALLLGILLCAGWLHFL